MPVCPKCDSKLTKEDAFCPDCGYEIKVENPKRGEKTQQERVELSIPKKQIKVISVLVGVLIVLALVIFAVPLQYTATEAYTVKEPFDDEETYFEFVPISVQEPYMVDFTFLLKSGKSSFMTCDLTGGNLSSIVEQTYIMKNLENESGCFRYETELFYLGKSLCAMYPAVICLNGNEEKELTLQLDFNVCTGARDCPSTWGGTSRLEPKFTQIPKIIRYRTTTEFQQVEKNRTVTKYKEIYKERSVTKYATLFQQWTGQVKWYYKEGE